MTTSSTTTGAMQMSDSPSSETKPQTELQKFEDGERRLAVMAGVKWGPQGVVIDSMADAWRFAQMVSQSGMYPGVDTPQKAIVKGQSGAELGFSFNASMQNVHMIEGRPVVGAHMMLAAVIKSKIGRYKFLEMTPQRCCIEWTRLFDGEWLVVGQSEWTLEEARGADLLGRGPWKKTPADMLRARAIGRGTRAFFPDLLLGALEPDEALDIKDVGPQPASTPVRGNAAVNAALGRDDDIVDSTVVVVNNPPAAPAPTKPTTAKKEKPKGAAGEPPPPASSTVTPPASPVVAPPAPPPAPTTPATPASATTSMGGQSSSSEPDASTSVSVSSSEVGAADLDVVDAEVEDMPGESTGPMTTETETSASDDVGADNLVEDQTPPSGPSEALVAAVRGLKLDTPPNMASYIAQYRAKLDDVEYVALRTLALALNNRRGNVPIDNAFNDMQRAALVLVRSIEGNPIDKPAS